MEKVKILINEYNSVDVFLERLSYETIQDRISDNAEESYLDVEFNKRKN